MRCSECHRVVLGLQYHHLLKMTTQNHFVMTFLPLSRSQLYWFMQGNLLVFTHNALRC